MPTSLSSYSDLLKVLIALGPKLPAAWEIIQQIYELVKQLIALTKPTADPGTLELYSLTTEEEDLEAQLAAVMVGSGSMAIFDGSIVRRVYAFAKEHPELMALLLSLLKG